jgi:hypothetical protein
VIETPGLTLIGFLPERAALDFADRLFLPLSDPLAFYQEARERLGAPYADAGVCKIEHRAGTTYVEIEPLIALRFHVFLAMVARKRALFHRANPASVALEEHSPINVVRWRERMILAEGYHRTLAFWDAGFRYVPCRYVESTPGDFFDERLTRHSEDAILGPILRSAHLPTIRHYTNGRAQPVRLRSTPSESALRGLQGHYVRLSHRMRATAFEATALEVGGYLKPLV